MLPGMELMGCQTAVPAEVMHHVVRVESSYNPYAIGVVGGHLVRQPRNLPEALATVRMLESRGYNFSLGLAQVNRYNLARYGLDSYEKAFETCPNLQAGARILTECYHRAGRDWGKSFSCYYSGNFVTGYRHGYVQKIYASMRGRQAQSPSIPAIEVVGERPRRAGGGASQSPFTAAATPPAARRIAEFTGQPPIPQTPRNTQAIASAGPQPQGAATAVQQPPQVQIPFAPQATATGNPAPVVSVQPRRQQTAVVAATGQGGTDGTVDAAFVF
jgi:type IV secretion system protein VirB1